MVAIWLHCRQIQQQQYKHMPEKMQAKTIIPNIGNNFVHQEFCDLNQLLSSRLGVGITHGVQLCPHVINKHDTLADSSGMNT